MKVKIVKKIIAKGYPTSSKYYAEAHSEADHAEKKKFPKSYKIMKKVDRKLGKNELVGTHDKKGNIRLSKKVPKKSRKDIEFHEEVERKADARLRRNK